MGNAGYADSIRVIWPDNKNVSVVRKVKADQTISISENESRKTLQMDGPSLSQNTLFESCNNMLVYKHEQNDFIDFFLNQKILPHKFSQIGPVMAKGDIDGDGRADLVTGSTNISPTAVYLRRGSGFIAAKFEGLTDMKDITESDLAVIDIDNDGDNDVIAVAGGYETNKENSNQQSLYQSVTTGTYNLNLKDFGHYLYENNNGKFVKKPLPLPPFIASVIRPCDFDHDGFVDLFIGARVHKGAYPYSDHSWILRNVKGQFSPIPVNGVNLGMVTDAVWTDYNKDGWEDLLVTREWNSPVLLKNVNGKELVPQSIPELDNQSGFWSSVAAGDFDKDGDDDYVLGNFGDNHRFVVSNKYPLSLYAVDIELDGILDPLMTAYWKDKNGLMKEYPVNYLDELKEQSSYFQTKFNDYTTFSYSDINDMFDAAAIQRMKELRIQVNTTSSYILWNDGGKFRWELLPMQIQAAPVKKILVRDFNNDTFPDILIGGNDYSWDVSTGIIDANPGIVLLNRGKNKGFDVLGPSRSGISLKGMVQSLLCFEGDTTLVVAGINRGEAAVFRIKR